MFWLKMAFGSNCGEKKLEFFHQKSALPMIFFKSPQKTRNSKIFEKSNEPSFLTKNSSQIRV